MWIDLPSQQTCQRCAGKGYYFVKLFHTGQDRRLAPVQWKSVTGPFWCDVCAATGMREVRSPIQTEPKHMRIHEDGSMTHERSNAYGMRQERL